MFSQEKSRSTSKRSAPAVPQGPTRASGLAAVAKIVDFSVPPDPMNSWVHPENEAAVYNEGYFSGNGLSFRPARCYHISRPSADVVVLWLEDLTGAKGPPFTPPCSNGWRDIWESGTATMPRACHR